MSAVCIRSVYTSPGIDTKLLRFSNFQLLVYRTVQTHIIEFHGRLFVQQIGGSRKENKPGSWDVLVLCLAVVLHVL